MCTHGVSNQMDSYCFKHEHVIKVWPEKELGCNEQSSILCKWERRKKNKRTAKAGGKATCVNYSQNTTKRGRCHCCSRRHVQYCSVLVSVRFIINAFNMFTDYCPAFVDSSKEWHVKSRASGYSRAQISVQRKGENTKLEMQHIWGPAFPSFALAYVTFRSYTKAFDIPNRSFPKSITTRALFKDSDDSRWPLLRERF